MALGRWKQRAASLAISLESTDSLLPEEDDINVAKKPRLQLENKKASAPPKSAGLLDEDRPSSGDSGISSDQSGNHQRLSLTHLASPEAGEMSVVNLPSNIIRGFKQEAKREPLAAVDLSKNRQCNSIKVDPTTKTTIRIKSENPNSDNRKENCLKQVNFQKSQKPSRKTYAPMSTSPTEKNDPDAKSGESHESADSLRLRRIEANARERSRVHTIGAAFDALRQAVPSNSDQQKLSKLAVLRIAAAYIRSLAALAQGADLEDFSTGVNQVTQALLLDGARTKPSRVV